MTIKVKKTTARILVGLQQQAQQLQQALAEVDEAWRETLQSLIPAGESLTQYRVQADEDGSMSLIKLEAPPDPRPPDPPTPDPLPNESRNPNSGHSA